MMSGKIQHYLPKIKVSSTRPFCFSNLFLTDRCKKKKLCDLVPKVFLLRVI